MSEEIIIDWEVARDVSTEALVKAGVPEAHAAIQVDLLIEADLRGRASHGLQRLPRIIERIRNGVLNPATTGSAVWVQQSFLQIDGESGLGPVVGFSALQQVTRRARDTGIAIAAISNNNHLGMLALYAERVAQAGQILIALTTSEALVHPWGGREAMLGTNPISIGVPAKPLPFVLDMATSLVSMGQIHDHANRDQPIVPGWALDANGDPTVDAIAARNGALAPFGGAKGYALGLSFELLVAALTGSALGKHVKGTLDTVHPCNKGDIFIAIEPGSHGVADAMTAYLDDIRLSAPSLPGKSVAIPGDRAHMQRAANLENGISVAPKVWGAICELAGCDAEVGAIEEKRSSTIGREL